VFFNPVMTDFFTATGMPDADWWQTLWPRPLDVIKKSGIKPDMTVVDLCCGHGLFTAPLSVFVDGKVVAIDLDPENLALARRHVNEQGAPECRWITGDARDLEKLVPEAVDCVFIANTFHGVPDKNEMANQVYGILKPEGIFVIVNWHPIPRELTTVLGQPRGPKSSLRMSSDDVCRIVEPEGFSLINLVDLPPYHYATIFKKNRPYMADPV
jgi:SAM-dependent methyltransferase